MYVNKCIKCGREFETKNPKRVICPECLYPDKKMMVSADSTDSVQTPKEEQPKFYSSYSADAGNDERPQRRDCRAHPTHELV